MKVAINIYPLKSAHKDRGIGNYTVNLIQSLRQYTDLKVCEFISASELKDVDIVHYPWFDFFFHTLPIRKKFKTIVAIHDVIPLVFPEKYPVGLAGKFNFFLQKLALRDCNIITDSEASKIDINKFLHVNKEKVSVIYLAAGKDFKPLNNTKLLFTKRKYSLPDQFLLYVGDANWIKNIPFLIEGFTRLLRMSDFKGLKLVLIGNVFLKNVENIDHPELESLKNVNRMIRGWNLGRDIITPGRLPLEELVAFYNLATAYVQPSLYEGFGLPVLEAMSCGTPVVASNKGSLKEIGGNAVIYFDPKNLNQFISILEELLRDKSLQNKLSNLGFEQVKKYTWEKTSRKTADLYSQLVKK